MSKLILISFADKRYRNSLMRLDKQTKDFPFDERYFLTQDNCLTKEYWRSLKPWLYRRGYGYWDWKSHLIKEYIEKVDEGDVVVWSDVGVYWNSLPNAMARFHEYVSLLNTTNIVAFQEPYIEQEWTKGDLLEKLGVYDNNEVCETNQLWSGCMFIKKNKVTCELVNQWASLDDIRKEYVTDKKSFIPNKDRFKEHRHDQSSFSLLTKQIPHIEISWKETQVTDNNWESLANYPIQARRLKEQDRPMSEIIKNKLLRPWREILHIYFKYIRHYEYLGRYVW